MKRNVLAVLACALCFTGLAGAATTISVGTGADVSFFVLESPNVGSRTYEVHYTYNSSSPQDAWALLSIIDSAESGLSIDALDYGDPGSPNYIINAITWLGVTETNTGGPTYSPSWSHYVSGGGAGYPSAVPVSSGSWSDGSGVSSPYRYVAPGSWDALVYGAYGDQPSVTPVPEIAAPLMSMMGLALLWCRRPVR
jgi:hypothetical protein